jgi:hypothetical protein
LSNTCSFRGGDPPGARIDGDNCTWDGGGFADFG